MVSSTATSAVLLPETDQVFLVLMEFTKADGGIRRLVNNQTDITHLGNVYTAAAFEPIWPAENDSEPQIKVRIANVDQEIQTEIQALTEPAPVTFKEVLAATPDTIERQFDGYEIINAGWDAFIAETTLSQRQFTQEPYPAKRVTPEGFSAIFL